MGEEEEESDTFRVDVKRSPFAETTDLFLMINEAARLVQNEDLSAEDVDKSIEFGFGWEKGPLKIADGKGLDKVVEKLEELAVKSGDERYEPCSLLKKYVKRGRSFYE